MSVKQYKYRILDNRGFLLDDDGKIIFCIISSFPTPAKILKKYIEFCQSTW